MTMSDKMRQTLIKKGLSAAAAACLFALVQGCATQPMQTQTSTDYVAADPASTDPGPADPAPDIHGHRADHHRQGSPYFRTVTSTSEGSLPGQGNTIHY